MSSPNRIDRRGFVKVVLTSLGGIMGTIIGIPAIGYLISPAMQKQESEAWIQVGPLVKYPVNVPTLFSFTRTKINGWEKTVNSYGVFVLKKNDTEAVVYSNKCTHLSCRVNWKDENQEYICPCHDGHFAKDGSVISGPPPKPLQTFETKIEDGNLLIYVKEG